MNLVTYKTVCKYR